MKAIKILSLLAPNNFILANIKVSETWRVLLGLSIFVKFYGTFRVYFIVFAFELFKQTCLYRGVILTNRRYLDNKIWCESVKIQPTLVYCTSQLYHDYQLLILEKMPIWEQKPY